MTKVLIADDSAIVRSMVAQAIGEETNFEIAGMAENGLQAVEMCLERKPDLVIMDINMPVMNGLEATRCIRKKMITAIIAFTTEDTAEIGYRCLDAGAVDVIQKPNLATMDREKIKAFMKKIGMIASSHKKQRIDSDFLRNVYYARSIAKELSCNENKAEETEGRQKFSVLAIGASTGGPVAIQKILRGLGPSFPIPILITQHMDETFENHFAHWLTETTGCIVTPATDGQMIKPAHAYLAPSGKHLALKSNGDGSLATVLDDGKEVNFFKPSVDKMFSSCAKTAGKKTIAVLLTGMGQDGAAGMKEIFDAGGYTIAESENSCAIYGMPKAAVELEAVKKTEDIDAIAGTIKKISGASNE